MIRKIRTYIETNRLLNSDDPVVVGFSGGGDSVSLLYILNRLGYKCIAAHCNFNLRGDESRRDEDFCRRFADEHNIDFENIGFDTRSYATEKHVSVEMAARELRYRWFEKIRIERSAQSVAVAHNRDDNVETILLNIIRGTGIRGLSGIQPVNGFVVRPMLCVDHDEIIRFLNDNKLGFVTDSSNMSYEYARNCVRLRLLPMMEEINPSVRRSIIRMSEHVADAAIIYDDAIDKARKSILSGNGDGSTLLSVDELNKQKAPKTVLFEILKNYGFTPVVSDEIFKALTGESGKTFIAPESGYKLLKDRDYLVIYKSSTEHDAIYTVGEDGCADKQLPIGLSMSKIPVDATFKIDKTPYVATFDYDKLRFPLTLRRWRAGDWFIPFGMRGKKKLSDFFTDNKYSLLDKENTWILCSGNDIVWIAGKRADNRFRVNNNTKFAFEIIFFEKYSGK
ncbi:MAG: tRNA lysidine(34) synthetase TilS [Tannerella sp.]|nr:tRNA lysidine(34) synthetase TilS [Tannerella sp.]